MVMDDDLRARLPLAPERAVARRFTVEVEAVGTSDVNGRTVEAQVFAAVRAALQDLNDGAPALAGGPYKIRVTGYTLRDVTTNTNDRG
jgi:hypothetical protein